jgi:uncharacterized phage protein gp47/JayE
MAIPAIPTIREIKERIQTDIQSKINQTIPALPLSFVALLSSAIAGPIFLLYQAILWVYKQIFPQSADLATLILLGEIVGITPVEAVPAVLLCDVPGSGAQVDEDEAFIGNNGITYRVTTATPIAGGVASNVPMKALTAGDAGNLANGEELSIVQTNLNLDGTATVTGTQTTGADQESDQSFSARVQLRYRTRYITGSPGAYAINGLETPNFIWIGPYSGNSIAGVGQDDEVVLYGKVDNQPDGIPTQTQLDELEAYSEFVDGNGKAYLKPINDKLLVLPIARQEFDVEIFINASDAQINAAIQSALDTYIDTLEPFIIGVSGARNDVLTEADTASEANGVAQQEGAKVTSVLITNVTTGLPLTIGGYSFTGGTFGKFRNYTFTVVL